MSARVPAGLYAGDLGHGLLLPAYPVSVSTITVEAVVGLVLGAGSAAVGLGLPPLHPASARLGTALVGVLAGLLLLGGAYRGRLSRRRPARGLLLTPDFVVLGDRREPVRLPWDDVDVVAAAPDAGRLAFRTRASGDEASGPAVRFGVEPRVVLAVCRYYLEHPESRAELTTTGATDRVAGIARGL